MNSEIPRISVCTHLMVVTSLGTCTEANNVIILREEVA